MRCSVSLVLGTALLGMMATPGWAQAVDGTVPQEQADPGRITVIATRVPVALEDVPATVSIITDEQIADELVTDIKDLVRFEPGVSVRRAPARFGAAAGTTGRAGNEGFNIRGIGGNRVLIQVDGVRVPDGFSFGAQSAGRGDYVDLGLIRSVEILRGPASALYGSDGLAGAVSFITADPVDFLQPGAEVGGLARAAYNSADEEWVETLIGAARLGRWSIMAAYTRRDFQKLDNQGDVGGTGALRSEPNPQDGSSDALLGRIVLDVGGGHRLRLTGETLRNRLSTDVLSGLSPTIDRLQARDTGERARVSADWTWNAGGVLDFAHAAAYWQNGEDRQFTAEDRTPATDRTRLNTFENEVYGGAADARFRFATSALAHRIVFGGDFSVTEQKGLRDGTVPPVGEIYPTRAFPTTGFTRIGLFLTDEIALGRNRDGGDLLTLYPALRFDHYDLSPQDDPLLDVDSAQQDGSRVSPKFGAVLAPAGWLRVFGNYAQGFKAPEPGEVNQFFSNLAFGYTSRPNPDLGPERSESFEGGVRFVGEGAQLEVTGFSGTYKDFISQEVVGGSFTPRDPAVYQFINLGRVEIDGFEVKGDAELPFGLTGRFALSYAKGDQIDPDGTRRPLSTVDPLKIVGGMGYSDPAGRFGGQVIATYSARKSAGRTDGVCTAACYRPDSFVILDATAHLRLAEGVTLRAGIFNIFDEKYAWWSDVRGLNAAQVPGTAGYVPLDAFTQPGRNASASLSCRF